MDVQYGQIQEIENIDGVKEVVIETRYEPAVVQEEETVDPNMSTSSDQIGSAIAWANGYTGAGSRVAIIDTGVDTDHPSFSAAAYQYSLAYNAGKAGVDIDEYVNSLDLLDVDEIEGVLEQLNIYERSVELGSTVTAEELYINSKIPFGYNYIDCDFDVTHDNNSMTNHGSHVAGISAANAYIQDESSFVNALDSVFVQGVAPDAQIINMKVFGKDASMVYDEASGYLFLTSNHNGEEIKVYAIDPVNLISAEIGSFGTSAEKIVSLYQQSTAANEETANPIVGATNTAVNAVTRKPAATAQSTDASTADGTVTLTITEEEASSNGLIQVKYDPTILTYSNVTSTAMLTAVNVDAESGTITFAYANETAIEAGNPIAAVNFTYTDQYISTDITVTTLERGDKIIENESVTVEISHEVGEHTYQVTDSRDAACVEDGYKVYTCSKCGDSYREDIPATGHSYGEWTVTRQETCTEAGQQTSTCVVCGDVQVREIPAFCPAEDFSDLGTTKWYHDGVCYVLREGLMNGIGDGKFAPYEQLTRGQLVTILYRLEGTPDVSGLENPFEDVPTGRYYTDAVIWAANTGIIKGVSETVFAPNDAITREQIATILYRYTGAEAVEADALKCYSDASSIAAYARDAMNWAVAKGLIAGTSHTTLAPKDTASRAQIATILMRYSKIFG